MNDLISVIVPVYNTGQYLRRCIESIVAQDYPNLEIIIIDDGSTDSDTISLCDTIATEFDNVYSYHKTNGGQSSARNFGISLSNGKYIGFIDSDDIIESNMYSSLYNAILEQQVEVAIGGITAKENQKRIDDNTQPTTGLYNSQDLLRYFFLGYFHSSCTNLYHRDLFDTAKFPENEINEDYMLNYLIFRSLPMAYVDTNIYYHYIKRPGSITTSPVSLKFLSWLKHTSLILNDYKDTPLHFEAEYQYIYSNIVLGNKCLLNLSRGANSDANELYELVSSNLYEYRIQIFKNKCISCKNKFCGLMLAMMPGLYRILVLLVLRLK